MSSDPRSPLIPPVSETVEQTTTYAAIDHRQPQESPSSTNNDVTIAVKQMTTRTWRSNSYVWSIIMLGILLFVSTCLEIAVLKFNLPGLDKEDREAIHFPKNFDDLKALNAIMSGYIQQHFVNVYTTFFFTYIYLQSFSLPGSMWLSILGGALFNPWLALLTVAISSAIGSTVAYAISASLGSVAVMRLFSDRFMKWNDQLADHRKHMFNYVLVLKLAPLPPNWLINLGAPHLNVPVWAFFWGTFLGVAPPSFIHVQAGAALDKLSSSDELVLMTPMNALWLIAIGIAALIPVYVRRRYHL
ncbi:snare associated Golgi protein-domain-containing protein [Radiomyces spectabilis]|uniref:snare associated Golgi protein-domain-containing protein n=1 Tax=Radiomyces spectabilis TaxID=64574 RepID=UPI002220C094|nr:snare associated Golgi protein-domain-containing protein [Radiomyces spectabilis]KAI8381417.1 snare associated Golgi protein-domain-containing protein [Radiomyces spectabilis]